MHGICSSNMIKKTICLTLCLCVLLFSLNCCGKKAENDISDLFSTNETSEKSTSQSEAPSATELTPQINSSTVVDSENHKSNYSISFSDAIIFGKAGGNTVTGYYPLESVSYTVQESKKELSDEMKSHSHGPASGGKPHHTVVEFQEDFEPFSALTLDTVSEEKTLYLTFDCGYEHDNLTADILDTLKEKKVPAAFFCTLDHIKAEPELIKRMITEGHIVGNHSATHPSFAEISRNQMAKEIEQTENYLRESFGYAARFFRFPKGEYTENALDLIASLGYISVFWSVAYDDWNVESVKGKDYAIDTVMSRLHNGAVILLHSVSKDNADALAEIIDLARAEGYIFRSLTEYKKMRS